MPADAAGASLLHCPHIRAGAGLADTGFAKATPIGDERLALSVGQGACYTPGYADPIVINGGEYSAVTDGYAIGMTLLVCLTNRSPIAMIDRCEAEFGRDWDAISGHKIAGGTKWPPEVADAVKKLCFAGDGRTSLCADRRRNRSSIEQTMRALQELQPKNSSVVPLVLPPGRDAPNMAHGMRARRERSVSSP